jgi:hypothetical protein
MGRGPILDRPLEPAWLDEAFKVGREAEDLQDARRRLEWMLAGTELRREGRAKTITALVRTWVDPPASSASLVLWARESVTADTCSRDIHFGALLAAYPFFGDVCSGVGRSLGLEEQVATTDLRGKMIAIWGDRKTVHVSVRFAVKTLRAFGLLTGEAGTSMSRRGERLAVSTHAARWIVHALLLCRGAEAIDERDVRAAPELFGLELPDRFESGYPLIERHAEGGGRTVLALR